MADFGIGEAALLGASLLGSGMQYKASSDAANQQRKMINRAGETAQKITSESIDTAKRGAQKYDPAQREIEQAAAEQSATQSLGNALVEAQNKQEPQDQGRVSNEYLTSKAQTASDRLNRGMKIAQMMAKIRAPNDLRSNESISSADTASRISGLQGDANSAFRAGQVDAGGVMPNGGQMLLGDLVKTGGSMYYNNDRASRLKNSGIYGGTPSGGYV